jgi:hypothetical protein
MRILGSVAGALNSGMTESQILAYNERLKAFSNYLFNPGAALTAAAGARLWALGGPDLTSLVRPAAAPALLPLGSGLPYLPEPALVEAE